MNTTRRRSIFLLAAAALAPRVAGAAESAVFNFERPLMGTLFKIRCHHGVRDEAVRAADESFAAAAEINAVASDYIADSEILSLSKHPAGTAVKVSPLLFRLLAEARELAEKTGGAFDPTIGPLTKLWRESRRRGRLPDADILAAARAATGWRHLSLDEAASAVTLHRPGMRLDLGGIAKGQAADAMLAVMAKYGISRTSVTAGGDVRLGDPPPGAAGWNVEVRVFDKERASRVLVLENAAVSTSGDLQQFVEIDGVRYSHIIDPATGLGLTRRVAATVIAPRAALSDALATAGCTAGPDRVEELVLKAGATKVFLAGRDE